MEKREQALIIGRFQPLCANHVALFEEAKKLGETILVAVGQPNYALAKEILDKNHFSHYQMSYIFPYERVKEWIDDALGSYPHIVVPVRDIFSEMVYASHVEHSFSVHGIDLDDCVLLGENERTIHCFGKTSIDVHLTDYIANFHATDVRKELVATGKSSRLYATLTNKEIDRIIRTERVKEHIGKEGHVIHDGHVHVVQQPHKSRLYDVVISPDAVVVMYIDNDDQVWFCRQYRVPVQKEVLELPAETIDKPGKSPLEHAVEGLAEECGITISPSQVESIGIVGSTEGHDTEHVHLFLARGPHTYVGQNLCGGEEIDVEKVCFSDAYSKMLSGEISGSKSRILLQHEYIKRLEGGTRGVESKRVA